MELVQVLIHGRATGASVGDDATNAGGCGVKLRALDAEKGFSNPFAIDEEGPSAAEGGLGGLGGVSEGA